MEVVVGTYVQRNTIIVGQEKKRQRWEARTTIPVENADEEIVGFGIEESPCMLITLQCNNTPKTQREVTGGSYYHEEKQPTVSMRSSLPFLQ